MENLQPRGKHLILIIISAAVAMFMPALDGTIVNITQPTISEVFSLSSSTVTWVSTVYLMVMAGSLLIVGKITDIIGIKKIFIAGFTIFTIGSLFCGYLPILFNSFYPLLIGRAVQGFGGALMNVIAPALASKYSPENHRAKGIAIVLLFSSLGMALGPTLGGIIIEYASWNWVFYLNIPVGIFAVIFGLIVIPKSADTNGSLKGFDIKGAALIIIGIVSFIAAISEGFTFGWTSPVIIGLFIIAAVCVSCFIYHELRTESPLFDLRLFRNKNFVLVNIILAAFFGTFAGANYLLPFFLKIVKEMSSAQAGLILTMLSFGMILTGLISGAVYTKMNGKIKYLVAFGVLLAASGYFLLTKLSGASGIGFILLALALVGLGYGLTITPVTTLLQGSVSKQKQGMISSLISLERYVPMSTGIVVSNLILIIGIVFIARNNGIITKPPHDIAIAILSTGFDFCFVILFAVAALVFILCFFINEKKLTGNK